MDHSVQRLLAGALGIGLLFCCLGVRAQAMRICVDEESHEPLITSTGGGMLGRLIREAASEAQIAVTFHSAPVARCRERLRLGAADAFPTTPYTLSLLPLLAYPTTRNVPDERRAVIRARSLAYRRIGSKAVWNGREFSGIESSVLIPTSAALLIERLNALGVPYDDNGKTLEQNFLKLAAGRAEIAIGAEVSGLALLADPRFNRVLERIATPFTEEPYYLAVTKTYHAAHGKDVEAMWRAIERIRASANYRADFARAMLEAEKRAPGP